MPSRTCPKCGREYPEETQLCEDCDQALVEAPPAPTGSGEMVLLTTLSGLSEAMVLTNVLNAEGIPTITEDLTLLALNITMGGAADSGGGVRVLVNSEDAEAALEILECHRRGELSLTDDEDEDE